MTILNNAMTIIIILLIIIAILAMISTILGFIRLPDELTKLHASGVTGSFAVELVLIAGFIFFYRYLNVFEYKLIIAIIFLFIVSPITAHMIGLTSIIYKKDAYFKRNKQIEPLLEDVKKYNEK
ncbi:MULTISPECIES: monovalent cation/H(+) antiporter subunit G [unclassified Gemella]|uniref:monovalent cation/H(+) antiporter subunit G n=1 Tax=unclassified Gemella TaxID=2624949 RepID=UPI001C04826F|nr:MULTISPECIES: monovalent cation/H(+) antiporter subunit G [unclassified Gemella]MBU0278696.1 monovalent cation/H(+) antiporter subunit G [Gemella sp. zg-1178]QWQ39248.1 monovalent cation/H(+) antiporter subunit G [Gemella sp. zg-570]